MATMNNFKAKIGSVFFLPNGEVREPTNLDIFHPADNNESGLLIHIEDGGGRNVIGRVNFTPDKMGEYAYHWYPIRFLGFIEHKLIGEEHIRTFAQYFCPMPSQVAVLNANKNTPMSVATTITLTGGRDLVGVYDTLSELISEIPPSEELADSLSFAYVFETQNKGFYQVERQTAPPYNYLWAKIDDNSVARALHRKQYDLLGVKIQGGFLPKEEIKVFTNPVIDAFFESLNQTNFDLAQLRSEYDATTLDFGSRLDNIEEVEIPRLDDEKMSRDEIEIESININYNYAINFASGKIPLGFEMTDDIFNNITIVCSLNDDEILLVENGVIQPDVSLSGPTDKGFLFTIGGRLRIISFYDDNTIACVSLTGNDDILNIEVVVFIDSEYIFYTKDETNNLLRNETERLDSDIERIDGEILRVENVCKNSENITWANLVLKRDNSELNVGQWYRIIDYETFTTESSTMRAGNDFDVLVLAIEKNKLSEQALATHSVRDSGGYFANSKLEAWKLWYCLDNDTNRFDWTDNVNGKGVIYRMIDEFNNDVPYDFKNILFYPETYTFDDNRADASISSQQVYNNRIKSLVYENIQYLNNIIIKSSNSYGNIFGNNNYNIILGNNSFNNTFGNNNNNITLNNDSYNNTFGNDCNNLTAVGMLEKNTFGTSVKLGVIGPSCKYMNFSNEIHSFKIPSNSYYLRVLEGVIGLSFAVPDYALLNIDGSTATLSTPRTYYKDKNGKFILEYAENGEIKRYYKDVGNEAEWTEIKYEDIIIEKLRLATDSLKGLMSATDKDRLDTIWAVFDDGSDTDFIDTIKEILDIFENYPESVDIVNLIGGKVDKIDGYGLSKNDYDDIDKAKVGKIITDGDGDKYLADDGAYKTISVPSVPVISIDIESDQNDDTKTASPKAVFDFGMGLASELEGLVEKVTNEIKLDLKTFYIEEGEIVHSSLDFTQEFLEKITLYYNEEGQERTKIVSDGVGINGWLWEHKEEESAYTIYSDDYADDMLWFFYDDNEDYGVEKGDIQDNGWNGFTQIITFELYPLSSEDTDYIFYKRNEAGKIIEDNVKRLVDVEVQDREFDVDNIISGATAISSALYNLNQALSLPTILGTKNEPKENSKLEKFTNSYALMPMRVVNGDYVEYHFDTTKWPFNEMVEVIEDGNTFIKIPKMYIKLEKDGDIINNRYISDTKIDETWLLSPAFYDYNNTTELDYVLVGKYNGYVTGSKLYSQSGKEPTVNTTITNFRTYAQAQGLGYQLFDTHIKFILETLYLIVFGNTHPDTYFPQGSNLNGKQNTGILDGMAHHTGYTKGLDNYLMKFMGIENYFSNIYTFVDGVKTYQGDVFVCNDPANYNSNNNTTNYTNIGEISSNGFISKLGTGQGLFSIPKATDGNDVKNYYQNYCYFIKTGTTYYMIFFGRAWNYDVGAGLFSWYGLVDFAYSSFSLGSRLVKKPLT